MCACRIADGVELFEQCGMQQAFVVGEGGEQIQAMFGQFMVLERMAFANASR